MTQPGAAAALGGGSARPPSLALFMLNVQGLTGPKLAVLLHWAQLSKYNVFVFLETHSASDPVCWGARQADGAGILPWRGWCYWTPGTAHSKGVLVLVKSSAPVADMPASGVQAHDGLVEARGRIVRVDFSCGGHPVTLVCAYVPTSRAERINFFRTILPPFLPSNRLLLLGADFNCVVSPFDHTDRHAPDALMGPPSTRLGGADALQAMALTHDLHDVWRAAAGAVKIDFTHWSAMHRSGARLDRWLVSGAGMAPPTNWQPSSRILEGGPVSSDHLPVELVLQFPTACPRGTGAWKLPVKLLAQPTLISKLAALAASHIAACPPHQAGKVWTELKLAFAREARDWSKEHARQQYRIVRHKVATAAAAKADLLSVAVMGADVCAVAVAWKAARAAVVQVHADASQRALSASILLDHIYGDSSTYWFHCQGRQPPAPVVLSSLRSSTSDPVAHAVKLDTMPGVYDALEIGVAHFAGDSPEGLFRPKAGIDMEARSRVLGRITKKLTPGQAAACEIPVLGTCPRPSWVSEPELLAALKRCSRGRAPGLDGLPYEFYVVMWEHVGEFLTRVFNEAFESSADAPLGAFLGGLICPVHKPGRVADHLSGYRPITLLNADVKLLSKTVADRMHLPLDYVVSLLQSAFIEGRDISENVLYHLGLADFLHDSGHPAWLLITDLAGAYDNVDRSYLLQCLAAYGFKVDGHVRWAALLHAGTTGCITMNGHISRPFPISAGLAQGAPGSTVYWTVVCEPLIQRINSLAAQGRISLPPVPGCAHPPGALAFADDIKALVSDPAADGALLVDACDEFEKASGVPLSVPKCVAVPLSEPARLLQPPVQADPPTTVPGLGFTIPPADTPRKLLGIPYTADYALAKRKAFDQRVGNMVAASSAWAARQLNFVGRVHVAKQCVGSIATYHASFLRPDRGVARKMQSVCRGLAARSDIPGDDAPMHGAHNSMQPAELVAALPWKAGGVNMVHLPSHFAALSAKCVARLFGPRRHPMRDMMLHAFGMVDAACHMPTWVVTYPSAPALVHGLPPRLRDYVEGFAETLPHRIVQPNDLGFYSVMAEPLTHNRQIAAQPHAVGGGHATCFSPSTLQSAEGQAWRYIRDVRAAHLARIGATAAVAADLACVLAALPAAWREHVELEGPPPATAWSTAVFPGGLELVCPGAGPPAGEAGLFVVLAVGRMEPVGDVPVPSLAAMHAAPWEPCLVVPLPKPPRHWTADDHAAVAQAKADQQEFTPEDAWSLGPWSKVVLDPTIWGHGDTPLFSYAVKVGRQRCLEAAVAQRYKEQYVVGRGMRPRIWEVEPLHAVQPAAGPSNREAAAALRARLLASAPSNLQPQPPGPPFQRRQQQQPQHPSQPFVLQPQQQPGQHLPNRSGGLAILEQEWLVSASLKHGVERGDRPPGEVDLASLPLWMQPSSTHRDAVVGRRRRVPDDDSNPSSSMQRLQPPLAELDDVTDVLQRCSDNRGYDCVKPWLRLHDSQLSRPQQTTAWRILHGALKVNGLRSFLHAHLPSSSAYCTHPACLHARAVETLSHSFLDCPAARPALVWLQDLWEAVAGERPPLDARVLLADDHRVWRPGEEAALGQLWTLLRVAMLHAVWQCRSYRHELVGSFSAAAVTRVVVYVRTAIERDWLRANEDVRLLSDMPADYFRGRDPQMEMDAFLACWAHRGVLCSIHGGHLALHLSLQAPVPMPV